MLRLLFASMGLALLWVLASWVMAPDSARADDNDGLLGGVVGGVVNAVDAPLGAVTQSAGATVSTVVNTVAAATPKPVDSVVAVVPRVVETVDAVVSAKPVTAIVTRVAQVVDPIVAAVPIVSNVVGSTPVQDVVAPVATVVEDSFGDVVGTPGAALPLPGLPLPDGTLTDGVVPGAGDSGDTPDLSAGVSTGVASTADVAAAHTTTAVTFDAAGWAASLSAPTSLPGSTSVAVDPATPLTAPLLPVGDAPLPAAPGPSGSASSSGGPAGAGLVATLAGTETAALLSGALLARAGDEATPSSLARDLSSTPD
jgi:hypothetical protein